MEQKVVTSELSPFHLLACVVAGSGWDLVRGFVAALYRPGSAPGFGWDVGFQEIAEFGLSYSAAQTQNPQAALHGRTRRSCRKAKDQAPRHADTGQETESLDRTGLALCRLVVFECLLTTVPEPTQIRDSL